MTDRIGGEALGGAPPAARLGALPGRLRDLLGRLRPGRRVMPTPAGAIFLLGIVAIGLAAINTGNNLLYLLMGALLGTVAVSGWMSERTLRGLEVRRRLPRGMGAGPSVRIRYEVRNGKGRLPSFDVRIRENDLPGEAYVARLDAGGATTVRSEGTGLERGVYPLHVLTLSTTFPFGFVRKERDVRLRDELVVWPRSDRPVRIPSVAASAASRRGAMTGRAPLGHRGEYRGLREYRPGDDLRDVHWKKSAAAPHTVVREYEPEAGWEVLIHLDTSHEPGGAAEAAAELAASLAARASAEGRAFALHTSAGERTAGSGPGALEEALDLLARVRFDPDRRTRTPADPDRWILVTPSGSRRGRFGAVLAGGNA